MSTKADQWLTDKIMDMVSVQYQATGGYLDGMFMGGDERAGKYRFPIFGKLNDYKLTGAIEAVPNNSGDLSYVDATPDDFEASYWINTPDIYKMGPNEMAAAARGLNMAIKRRRDRIKLDALAKFVTAPTIGSATDIIDVTFLEQARAEIAATGADDMGPIEVFCMLPHMAMSQLNFYEEWNDADKVGDDLPFSMAMRRNSKVVNGVAYFAVPDSYFKDFGLVDNATTPDYFDTFMWVKSAVGAETPWRKDEATFTQHTDRQGSPWLGKTGVGGCAVGILQEGVKRLRFDWQTTPVRPAVKTTTV